MAKGKGSANGFPAEFKRLPPGGKASWLTGEECGALVESGRLSQGQVLAEAKRLDKEEDRLRPKAPVPSAVIDEYRRTGRRWPVHSTRTPPRQADVVLSPSVEAQVYWPLHYLRRHRGKVTTYDVLVLEDQQRRERLGLYGPTRAVGADRESTTESPSGAAIAALADVNGQIVEQKLAPDSVEALQGEIAHYVRTGEVAGEIHVDF